MKPPQIKVFVVTPGFLEEEFNKWHHSLSNTPNILFTNLAVNDGIAVYTVIYE